MKKLHSIFAVLTVAALCISAHADLWEDLDAHPGDAVITLFRALNKIYRPTFGEGPAREFILNLAKEAETRKWSGQALLATTDAAGNFVIRIPGTGGMMKLPPVSLQSHIDMVTVGEPAALERMKTEGVSMVEKDGWLQSEGHSTTLGADNGVGVATMMNFIVDPTLAHPPLELVFTVAEEMGLRGAREFDINLDSKVMINMDWADGPSVCTACMGAERLSAQAEIPGRIPTHGWRYTEFEISKFPGGHSGLEMHDDRPNPIDFAAKLLDILAARGARFELARFEGGSLDQLNVIANRVKFKIASVENVTPEALEIFEMLKNELSIKNREAIQIEISENVAPEKFLIPPAVMSRFFNDVLFKIDDQIVTLQKGHEWPHDILTSSNVGALSIINKSVTLGLMIRSFGLDDLKKVSLRNRAQILHGWPGLRRPVIKSSGFSEPWINSKDNWLYALARRSDPTLRTEMAPGTIESALFSKMFPKMNILVLGIEVPDIHRETERVRSESMRGLFHTTKNILEELGHCDHLIAGAN